MLKPVSINLNFFWNKLDFETFVKGGDDGDTGGNVLGLTVHVTR